MNSDSKDKKKNIGFQYAFQGIGQVWKKEFNFKIHCFIAILVILAGFVLRLSKWEWIVIILCIGIVLLAEMLNSAIEALMDYMFKDFHPVCKQVKDISAGAVLIVALTAAIIGVIIFGSKLYNLFL